MTTNYQSLSLPQLMYLNNFSARRFSRRPPLPSAVHRRHLRRRLLKPSSPNSTAPPPPIFKLSDDTLHITLTPPSHSIQRLESNLNRFLDYGRDALDDLRTVVAVDKVNGGVVVSCKRSTVEFFAAVLVSGLVVVFALKGLFRVRRGGGEGVLVYKRDRSLGGKEVVVGKRETTNLPTRREQTPLSSENADYYGQRIISRSRGVVKRRKKEELPQWWPQGVSLGAEVTDNKEEYQRLANQLIQVIMDRRMKGEDISPNDIVQLRHICKTYGVKTFISTANARDSLYRVSINFVLDYCESISDVSASIRINGEDVREFVAGLADNIGLESVSAARIISAAVAARTRSKILQAWALEVQNKHSEALVELFKVCLIHRVFPPEENSPEMEMVARGLDKSLNIDQKEFILNSFISVCGKDIDQSLVEALGLGGVKDEEGHHHVQI